ncbi:hypothetical protein TNCV_3246551 [Trichonephila clavipes]|nr:hypothetical protein TNCV_3246551 [Trichonephila clavipes]
MGLQTGRPGFDARCHQTPSEYTRSTCSLNQWVRSLVGLIMSAGTGEYFPPLQFTCRNCGGGDRGRVAIYRPFGELRRAKIVLSPVWCSRPTTVVPLAHATMNFVGLDLTASDRWHQKTTTMFRRQKNWKFLVIINITISQSTSNSQNPFTINKWIECFYSTVGRYHGIILNTIHLYFKLFLLH